MTLVVVPAHARGQLPLVRELVGAIGEQRGLPNAVVVPGNKVRAVGHRRRRVQGTLADFVPHRMQVAVEGAGHPVPAADIVRGQTDFLTQLAGWISLVVEDWYE